LDPAAARCSKEREMHRLLCIICMVADLCVCPALGAEDLARVNLTGYAQVPEFALTISPGSRVTVNGRVVPTRTCRVLPPKKLLITAKDARMALELITIEPAAGKVTGFTTPLGTQEFLGRIEIRNTSDGILIINTLPVRDYLASVLGGEMGGAFHDEALKAQAVAVRSYYYAKRRMNRRQTYDVCNTDGIDMVYRGSGFATPKMYEILDSTNNLYLVGADGTPALALFHSTSGGLILKDEVFSSDFYSPPREPVLCADTDKKGRPLAASSPYFEFEVTLREDQLLRALGPTLKLGRLLEIRLRCFEGTECVDFVGLVDENGSTHWLKGFSFVSMVQQRVTLRLGSIRFKVQKEGDSFRFTGTGFGHQCGMSQYSADKLARGGCGFREILRRYYPQYRLVKIQDAQAARN
jgi:stage II sporulation protein D